MKEFVSRCQRRKVQAEDLDSVKALKLELTWDIWRAAGGQSIQSSWSGVQSEMVGMEVPKGLLHCGKGFGPRLVGNG